MKNRNVLVMVVVSLVVLAMAGVAMAFTTPTNAGVGFSLYKLIVTDIVQGPIGTAAGVVMLAGGAVGAAMGKLTAAAWPLVGGGILVAAPTIATSLGMLF